MFGIIFRFESNSRLRHCDPVDIRGKAISRTTRGLLRRFSPCNDNQPEDINKKYSKTIFIKAFFLIAMMVGLSFTISCGRKAPPLPSESIEPPVVEKIKGGQDNGKLRLTWSIPERGKAEALAGFYVYRSKEKIGDLPCSQCPERFDKVADIGYDTVSLMIEKQAVYTEALEKGYRYKYRVTCYSAYGDEWQPSGEVTIDY
jgi:hypothetical protein